MTHLMKKWKWGSTSQSHFPSFPTANTSSSTPSNSTNRTADILTARINSYESEPFVFLFTRSPRPPLQLQPSASPSAFLLLMQIVFCWRWRRDGPRRESGPLLYFSIPPFACKAERPWSRGLNRRTVTALLNCAFSVLDLPASGRNVITVEDGKSDENIWALEIASLFMLRIFNRLGKQVRETEPEAYGKPHNKSLNGKWIVMSWCVCSSVPVAVRFRAFGTDITVGQQCSWNARCFISLLKF